jgi:long-chain acyl-CoA synthetase
MRLFASGGAPLSKKIAYFFDVLGYNVCEGYGLTETSAASSLSTPTAFKLGTVGRPLLGTECRIASDGEIMMRGPHIMKGYYRNEAATAEVLEPDGWFHSGDIGEIDSDGYLRITDRKKDIIVTAGGKNVAPQNLENTLKTYPLISQSMVYGDKRPYLTVLVCVNEESAKRLLAEKGVTANTYADVIKQPVIREAVQQVIDAVNRDQPPYNSLKKFTLLDHDFSQEGGEMTPTLKVKRKYCTQKYWPLLEAMYGERVL